MYNLTYKLVVLLISFIEAFKQASHLNSKSPKESPLKRGFRRVLTIGRSFGVNLVGLLVFNKHLLLKAFTRISRTV